MKCIETVLNGLRRTEQCICALAFATLVTVLFTDVLAREITGSGLHWATEAGLFANVLLVMAGFGLAGAGDTHLRPRFADGWLPSAWQPLLQQVGYLLTAVFCGVLCASTFSMVLTTAGLEDRSVQLGWPLWAVQAILPLAFGSATVRYICFGIWPALVPLRLPEGVTTG